MNAYIGTKLIKAEKMDLGDYNKYRGWQIPADENPSLPSGVSIGSNMVDDFIKEIHVSTLGDRTTLVRCVLVNGFEIIETSACVDPLNYNENMGAEICMKKSKTRSGIC